MLEIPSAVTELGLTYTVHKIVHIHCIISSTSVQTSVCDSRVHILKASRESELAERGVWSAAAIPLRGALHQVGSWQDGASMLL